jgi:hypothetical protein
MSAQLDSGAEKNIARNIEELKSQISLAGATKFAVIQSRRC